MRRAVAALMVMLVAGACSPEAVEEATTAPATTVATTTTGLPTTTSASTTTTSTTALPTTTTIPTLDVRGWRRVADDQGAFSRGAIWDVAVGGPGLVGVGTDGLRGSPDFAAWVSPDGLAWERTTGDGEGFDAPGLQVAAAVTAAGPGVVAVGVDDSGGDIDLAVWVSADGVGWQRVPHDEAVFGGPGGQYPLAVAVGGPGIVVVGLDDGLHETAVWVSSDGLIWDRVALDDGAFGREPQVSAMAAGGPGLVAVGWHQPLGSETVQPAAWTSADGVAWETGSVWVAAGGHTSQTSGTGGSLEAVSVGGPGLVAAGWVYEDDASDRAEHAAIWWSADGVTWTMVPYDEAVFGGPVKGWDYYSVVASESWLVASVVGTPDETPMGMWLSGDGVAWERVEDPGSMFDGGRVRLVGWGQGIVAFDSRAVWVNLPPP